MGALRHVEAAGVLAILAAHALRWPADSHAARALRARVGAPRPRLRARPSVSVLVAAWNEATNVRPHIESVLALRYPSVELVLCAGGSDGTLEIAREYERDGLVVLPQHAGEGKQRALLRAFERCDADIVFLTDADCVLDDEAFERTLAPLVNDGDVAASGASRPLAPAHENGVLGQLHYLRERYVAGRASTWSPGLLGRNAAVSRRALRDSGALAFPARTGTDYRVARALIGAGHHIRYVPESQVGTHYAHRVRVYAAQQSRWLRNLLLHAIPTGDRALGLHAASAVLAGTMLVLGAPAMSSSGIAGVAWRLAMVHGLCARLRQILAGSIAAGAALSPRWIAAAPVWLALDALIWASVPLQLASRRLRERW